MKSIIGRNNKLTLRELENAAVVDVKDIIANRGNKFRNTDTAHDVIGLESLDAVGVSTTQNTIRELIGDLKASANIVGMIQRHTDNPEYQEFALEAMAITILQGGDLGYCAEQSKKKAPHESGVITIAPQDGASTYSLESFDPIKSFDYLAATAVANSQAAIPGNFEETFFPQVMIPAGQSGYDVAVTIPKILVSNLRASAAGAFLLQKLSLIDAVWDPSILNSNATSIIPNADGTGVAGILADAAQVPTFQEPVSGLAVHTRPILTGVNADLIELSGVPALLANGVLDITDQLDPVVNVGDLYYELTVKQGATTFTSVYKTDIRTQVGALLTQKPTGRAQALQSVFQATVFIPSDFTPVSGDTNADITGLLETILGIAPSDKFTIAGQVGISAEADTETANMQVNITSSVVSQIVDANGQALPVTFPAGTSITITPFAYYPSARRTNSNLRSNGTIIDPNTTVNYRLAVNLSAPISSQAPINSNNNMTLEGLGHAVRLRVHGLCVNALTSAVSFLKSIKNIPVGIDYVPLSPIMGGEFIQPYLIEDTIDVASLTSSLNSMDNLLNLRGALTSALSVMTSQAANDSGYLRALQMVIGDLDAYEIILVTDPQIALYLMEAGDVRTFGDGRKYVITKSNHKDIKGKIFFSFRMSGNTDEVHPLNFGCKLFSPPMTYEVQMYRNGRVTNEIQTVPRVNAYVNLPLVGILTVQNLDSMFITG